MDVWESEPFTVDALDCEHLKRVLAGNFQRHIDGWIIRRTVGHVVLPSGTVLHVRSKKSSSAALLMWAAYCDPSLRALRFLGTFSNLGSHGSIAALASRMFAAELLSASARSGLARHYERLHVRASIVRGRIDFSRAVRRGGQIVPIPCVVWERTPNTPLNRLFAAACKVIARDAVMRTACERDLPKLTALLGGVRPEVDPEILRGTQPLSRNLQHLEPSAALARLILRGIHLNEGTVGRGAAFLLNVEALFERTVVQAFREAAVPSVPKHPVHFQRIASERATSNSMELDVFLPTSSAGPLVVDAKYKTSVASENFQQAVTYCYLTGAHQAFLVIPAGHSEVATYRFETPLKNESILVHVVELATNGQSVEEWRAAARSLVQSIIASH
jgi:5-methylcytosine-specific restriction endonuclease McrBC regulatory subunit McrC